MARARIGVVGTGFIARNFLWSLDRHPDYEVGRVLTRRTTDEVVDIDRDVVTNSLEETLANCDVVLEVSGDPIWATEVVDGAVTLGLPVVTMNTEFHITCGSFFVGKGLVTEAEGDQPGCLAALHEETVAMGFEPVAYGNMKGFLNPDPTPEDMAFWGSKQGISLPMVTSFTDGTKVQAEQLLVANHFGAGIVQEGMLGAVVGEMSSAVEVLVDAYEKAGQPISDFVVSPQLPHGVFIVAKHDPRHAPALAYYKMGDGPYYAITKPNILVHLEIMKTVRRVLERGEVLLDNSARPALSLAAVAKSDLSPGEEITQGIGSFQVRGHAVRLADHPAHVPIGLLASARITESVEKGRILTFEDVEIPGSRAVEIWRSLAGL